MPNDAKLGLVIGLAVVIAIGVVFYRKEQGNGPAADRAVSSTDSGSEAQPGQSRSTRGQPVNRGESGSMREPKLPHRDGAAFEAAPDQQPAPE
jgi:hypothetical protein